MTQLPPLRLREYDPTPPLATIPLSDAQLDDCLHLGNWPTVREQLINGLLDPLRCSSRLPLPPGADGHLVTVSLIVLRCLSGERFDGGKSERLTTLMTRLSVLAQSLADEWATYPVRDEKSAQVMTEAAKLLVSCIDGGEIDRRDALIAPWFACVMGASYLSPSLFTLMALMIPAPDHLRQVAETTLQKALGAALFQAARTITTRGEIEATRTTLEPPNVAYYAGAALRGYRERGIPWTMLRVDIRQRWRRRRRKGLGEWHFIHTWFEMGLWEQEDFVFFGQSLVDLAVAHLDAGGMDILAQCGVKTA